MPTIDRAIKALETCFDDVQAAKAEQAKLRPESFLDEEEYDQRRQELDNDIRAAYKRMAAILERYEREPQRHFMRHGEKLGEFHKEGSYADSVFIMTKFPEEGDPRAKELQRVIDTVGEVIRDLGYYPRVANGPAFHRWLWDNVELFLVGCARGVAIVEDRYLPELNPNVAIEWGWMTGMGRDVLYLREKRFSHERADWVGLISGTFDWDDPRPGVEKALKGFLPLRA